MIGRWGTFLNAAFHHYKNLNGVKKFISCLKGKTSDVKELKELIEGEELVPQYN